MTAIFLSFLFLLSSIVYHLSSIQSELPVHSHIPLPFLMPHASEASFCVCVEAGVSVDVPGAAKAFFVPGVPVVFAVVIGFSVRSGEVEVSFAAEFMV
jgi:hypothetical protein